MSIKPACTLDYTRQHGLTLRWNPGHGLPAQRLPLRVLIKGANTFYVWGMVDSGEGAPLWAEEELDLTLFGPANDSPDTDTEVLTLRHGRDCRGWRVTCRHPRVEAVLELTLAGCALEARLALRNPQHAGGRNLPLCVVELQLGGVQLGADATFMSAHAYGGRTHGVGRLAELVAPGMPFHHGSIGLALPLVYLHEPKANVGLEFEFMLDSRPTAWLRPGAAQPAADFALSWTLDRLLLPQQCHAFGGRLRVAPFAGSSVQALRDWRDTAAARYGIRPPPAPDWVKKRSCIELWLNPGAYRDFRRFDDPKLRAMLQRWREWGYNAIMCVAPNPFGKHPLSPFHYEANDACGGLAAERVMLQWMHELGFRAGIWFTTVGLDRDAPQVEQRRDWWTHRPNQRLFYAWDSTEKTDFVGYAPDADPAATGWRQWMLDQCRSLLNRGWNGVFIDGCIPRATNHARWFWPGESRNAVEDQVAEIAQVIRASGKDAIITDEDGGLAAIANCEITSGRYTPMTPFFKKAYWDHGMGGGPAQLGAPPARIPPELCREYLLNRYGSLLPGAISEDGVEGYCSEEARPWTVVTMLAGPTTFKTHAEYVNDPLTFRQLGDAPPAGPLARDADNRQRGHEEFLRLLKFREQEPLVHADVAFSIEAVVVDGDQAGMGFLRATAEQCLLVVVNFADRDAAVRVRLATPVDVPATQRPSAGTPQRRTWGASELLRSIRDPEAAASGRISGRAALPLTLGPYGFRVFRLNLP